MPLNPSDHTTPTSDEVIFFTGTNYTGTPYATNVYDQVDLTASDPVVVGITGMNDKLYSVKLGDQVELLVSRDSCLTGPWTRYTSDTSSISLGGPGSGLSSFVVLNKTDLSDDQNEDGFTFIGRCGHRIRVDFPCNLPRPRPPKHPHLPCRCHK